MKRIDCPTICAALLLALATNCANAVDIYIFEDSGFFGTPGVTMGTLGLLSSTNPAAVTVTGNTGDGLAYGGIDFRTRRDDGIVGFENTTDSLRVLGLTGGSTLVESVGYLDSGVAALTFSNDGLTAYVAGTANAWGRVIEADAITGEVLSVHDFISASFSGLATVPENTTLPFPPGEIWALVNTSSGVDLVRVDLVNEALSRVGAVTGLGFQAQFETGLDWAPDGTLYAAIQGFRFIGGGFTEEVSSHLFTINPFSAQATDLGVIQADQTWDVGGIAVVLEPCPETPLPEDVETLAPCLTGPAFDETLIAQCVCADLDLDNDVDLVDFAMLQQQ